VGSGDRPGLAELAAERAQQAAEQVASLDLSPERLAKWRDVIQKIYLPGEAGEIIEQFEGYFERKYVDLDAMEPRSRSIQEIFGIEGAAETQVLKQPDVLMLQYLLSDEYSPQSVQANYDYYTPRTDHTFGSSLGPSIQAIMACRVGKADDAYQHFIRAVRADLRDNAQRRTASMAHSAGGTWQAVVFGFGGLRFHETGWEVKSQLPSHWRRLAFNFIYRGEAHRVDIKAEEKHAD
jgi:kojibiose phosphorylase